MRAVGCQARSSQTELSPRRAAAAIVRPSRRKHMNGVRIPSRWSPLKHLGGELQAPFFGCSDELLLGECFTLVEGEGQVEKVKR